MNCVHEVYNPPREAERFVSRLIVDQEALAKFFTGVVLGSSLEIHLINYFEFARRYNWIYESFGAERSP